MGHLPAASDWDEARIDDIQHVCDPRCNRLGNSGIRMLAETARSKGIRHTPTLVAYSEFDSMGHRRAAVEEIMPRIWTDLFWAPDTLRRLGGIEFAGDRSGQAAAQRARTAVKEIIAAGGIVQAGSDTPYPFVPPGYGLHEELKLLAESGLSASQALQSATEIPGRFLPVQKLGELRTGAPADILLFRDDPTQSLTALSTLEFVIADGRVYSRQDLDRRLHEQLRFLDGTAYTKIIGPAASAVLDHLH